MKKYRKSIILLFLVFSLFISSCGFENEYSEEEAVTRPPLNTVSEESETNLSDEDVLADIKGKDYGGKKFVIATTDREFWETTSAETLIGKAVSRRNSLVEKKFNIEIEVKVETADEIYSNAKKAKEKGTYYADLIIAPANTQARLMSEGCLLNVNSLPYVDREASYFDKELADASQINGKLYLLFGDLTQTEYSSFCVFYNEEIAKKIGVDPYELYKKGEWTWDAFLDYSEKASEYTKNGFVTTSVKDDFLNVLWATSGERFFGECAYSPLLIPQNENGKQILSNARKIMKSKSFGKRSGNEALEVFMRGESGMVLCRRNAVYSICESDVKWNAVPMPKMTAESNYYSFVDGEALAASVFVNVEDSDFTGMVLNAILASTSRVVTQSIENNELYYYWTDNNMASAMAETKKYTYIDIAIIYAFAVKDIATVTTENIKTAYDAGISPFQFYHSTKRQFELYAKEHF